ncbi:hypothetical protein ONZ45_g15788 [Pleurotus djamor]|nr:hypothetical protein ONZ45_g15788 [Pleurotus djamor]
MPSASLAATLGALLTVTFKNPPAAEDAAKSLIEDPLTMERVGFIGIGDDKFKPTCLTDESASLFRTFLRTVRDLPNADKVKYIQDGTIDGAGRQAYKSWFKSICGDFNRRVELAMSETGYHPLQLLQTRIDDDYFDISSTASAALTDVALALFGPIVLDGSDVLVDSNLIGYMKTLLVFNYQRMARHRVRSQKDIDAAVEAMEEAMNAVNASNPPKMNDVRVAIRACKAVISIAIWFPERLTQAEEHMAFLDGFVRRNAKVPEGLDPHVVSEKPGAEERIARARERGYNIKASDSDLSDPYQIKQTLLALVTYLEEVNAADANPHAEDLEDISPDELFSEDGDMGVDLWKSKSPEELQSLLLFPGGKPQDWNAYSSVSGSTCWEKDVDRTPFQEGGPGFNPISLHWHQLAGVCSSTFKMFTAEPTTNVPGTILADGVGVGKTAQIMGTIAFLQQVFVSEQAADRSRPPLIANRPYFMGKGPVPDAPHLIVVPLSLMAQWHKELRTFFKDGAVDIFRLPLATGDVRKFFNHPKGAWKRSEQKMHKRIVICAQSTFTTLTSKSYNCARGAASIPVDRPRVRKPDSINTGTIFDIEWCSTTIDEAHLFRGPTRGFVGACQLRLSGKTWVLNLATATPLYTQFRDVFNLARMIGIVDFCLTEGLLWEKTLARRIQATKRSLTQAQRNALRTGDLRQLTGESVDNSAATEIRLTNYNVVKEIQRGLGHNIIRRTLDSKQHDGTALNGKMPPVTSHTIFVKLTERELKNLQLLVDEIGGGLVPSDLHLEHFWLKYRIGVIFFNIFGDDWPELIDGLINGIPYDACFSSKLQDCITLVKHLLSHDGVEHAYWTEEDGLVCPAIEPGTEIRQTRKVLVFYEFTMMTPTIVSIFRHFGVDPYVLNSTLNDREREAVVSSFVNGTDPARRVLLFSAVGAVGLNLTCADVIIMLDTQWSQVGVEQIIGRCARLTQEKPVHIYYLLALQTTDVLMTTLAREKGEMLDTLLTRGGNEELEKLLKGVNSKDLGNDDALDIDPATGSSSTAKSGGRSRKSATSKVAATETSSSSSSSTRQADTATPASSSITPAGPSTEVDSGNKKGKRKASAAKSKSLGVSKKEKVKGKGKATSPHTC